jgi:hypothetical protein
VDSDLFVASGAMVDFRVGFFADGRNDNGKALRPSGIQQQEGKTAVAGDQA